MSSAEDLDDSSDNAGSSVVDTSANDYLQLHQLVQEGHTIRSLQITEDFLKTAAAPRTVKELQIILSEVGRLDRLEALHVTLKSTRLTGQLLGNAIASNLDVLHVHSGLVLESHGDRHALAKALEKHSALTQLRLEQLQVQHARFPGWGKPTPPLDILIQAFLSMTFLGRLEIQCQILQQQTPPKPQHLLLSPKSIQDLSRSLQHLELTRAGLTDDHFVAIAQQQPNALTVLILNENYNTDEGLDMITTLLLDSPTCLLRTFQAYQSHRTVSPVSRQLIEQALQHNGTLTNLDLNWQSSPSSTMDWYLQLNRKGRQTLIDPTATHAQWIGLLAKVSDDVEDLYYCLRQSSFWWNCRLPFPPTKNMSRLDQLKVKHGHVIAPFNIPSMEASDDEFDLLSDDDSEEHDAIQVQQLHQELERQGIDPMIKYFKQDKTSAKPKDDQDAISECSLGEDSYLGDLLRQQESKDDIRRQETLEEALEQVDQHVASSHYLGVSEVQMFGQIVDKLVQQKKAAEQEEDERLAQLIALEKERTEQRKLQRAQEAAEVYDLPKEKEHKKEEDSIPNESADIPPPPPSLDVMHRISAALLSPTTLRKSLALDAESQKKQLIEKLQALDQGDDVPEDDGPVAALTQLSDAIFSPETRKKSLVMEKAEQKELIKSKLIELDMSWDDVSNEEESSTNLPDTMDNTPLAQGLDVIQKISTVVLSPSTHRKSLGMDASAQKMLLKERLRALEDQDSEDGPMASTMARLSETLSSPETHQKLLALKKDEQRELIHEKLKKFDLAWDKESDETMEHTDEDNQVDVGNNDLDIIQKISAVVMSPDTHRESLAMDAEFQKARLEEKLKHIQEDENAKDDDGPISTMARISETIFSPDTHKKSLDLEKEKQRDLIKEKLLELDIAWTDEPAPQQVNAEDHKERIEEQAPTQPPHIDSPHEGGALGLFKQVSKSLRSTPRLRRMSRTEMNRSEAVEVVSLALLSPKSLEKTEDMDDNEKYEFLKQKLRVLDFQLDEAEKIPDDADKEQESSTEASLLKLEKVSEAVLSPMTRQRTKTLDLKERRRVLKEKLSELSIRTEGHGVSDDRSTDEPKGVLESLELDSTARQIMGQMQRFMKRSREMTESLRSRAHERALHLQKLKQRQLLIEKMKELDLGLEDALAEQQVKQDNLLKNALNHSVSDSSEIARDLFNAREEGLEDSGDSGSMPKEEKITEDHDLRQKSDHLPNAEENLPSGHYTDSASASEPNLNETDIHLEKQQQLEILQRQLEELDIDIEESMQHLDEAPMETDTAIFTDEIDVSMKETRRQEQSILKIAEEITRLQAEVDEELSCVDLEERDCLTLLDLVREDEILSSDDNLCLERIWEEIARYENQIDETLEEVDLAVDEIAVLSEAIATTDAQTMHMLTLISEEESQLVDVRRLQEKTVENPDTETLMNPLEQQACNTQDEIQRLVDMIAAEEEKTYQIQLEATQIQTEIVDETACLDLEATDRSTILELVRDEEGFDEDPTYVQELQQEIDYMETYTTEIEEETKDVDSEAAELFEIIAAEDKEASLLQNSAQQEESLIAEENAIYQEMMQSKDAEIQRLFGEIRVENGIISNIVTAIGKLQYAAREEESRLHMEEIELEKILAESPNDEDQNDPVLDGSDLDVTIQEAKIAELAAVTASITEEKDSVIAGVIELEEELKSLRDLTHKEEDVYFQETAAHEQLSKNSEEQANARRVLEDVSNEKQIMSEIEEAFLSLISQAGEEESLFHEEEMLRSRLKEDLDDEERRVSEENSTIVEAGEEMESEERKIGENRHELESIFSEKEKINNDFEACEADTIKIVEMTDQEMQLIEEEEAAHRSKEEAEIQSQLALLSMEEERSKQTELEVNGLLHEVENERYSLDIQETEVYKLLLEMEFEAKCTAQADQETALTLSKIEGDCIIEEQAEADLRTIVEAQLSTQVHFENASVELNADIQTTKEVNAEMEALKFQQMSSSECERLRQLVSECDSLEAAIDEAETEEEMDEFHQRLAEETTRELSEKAQSLTSDERREIIREELASVLESAVEDQLFGEPMDPMAIEILFDAAYGLAYREKFYDEATDEVFFLLPVCKTIQNNSLLEIVEKEYLRDVGKWPDRYSQALLTVADSFLAEVQDIDYEYMDALGFDFVEAQEDDKNDMSENASTSERFREELSTTESQGRHDVEDYNRALHRNNQHSLVRPIRKTADSNQLIMTPRTFKRANAHKRNRHRSKPSIKPVSLTTHDEEQSERKESEGSQSAESSPSSTGNSDEEPDAMKSSLFGSESMDLPPRQPFGADMRRAQEAERKLEEQLVLRQEAEQLHREEMEKREKLEKELQHLRGEEEKLRKAEARAKQVEKEAKERVTGQELKHRLAEQAKKSALLELEQHKAAVEKARMEEEEELNRWRMEEAAAQKREAVSRQQAEEELQKRLNAEELQKAAEAAKELAQDEIAKLKEDLKKEADAKMIAQQKAAEGLKYIESLQRTEAELKSMQGLKLQAEAMADKEAKLRYEEEQKRSEVEAAHRTMEQELDARFEERLQQELSTQKEEADRCQAEVEREATLRRQAEEELEKKTQSIKLLLAEAEEEAKVQREAALVAQQKAEEEAALRLEEEKKRSAFEVALEATEMELTKLKEELAQRQVVGDDEMEAQIKDAEILQLEVDVPNETSVDNLVVPERPDDIDSSISGSHDAKDENGPGPSVEVGQVPEHRLGDWEMSEQPPEEEVVFDHTNISLRNDKDEQKVQDEPPEKVATTHTETSTLDESAVSKEDGLQEETKIAETEKSEKAIRKPATTRNKKKTKQELQETLQKMKAIKASLNKLSERKQRRAQKKSKAPAENEVGRRPIDAEPSREVKGRQDAIQEKLALLKSKRKRKEDRKARKMGEAKE